MCCIRLYSFSTVCVRCSYWADTKVIVHRSGWSPLDKFHNFLWSKLFHSEVNCPHSDLDVNIARTLHQPVTMDETADEETRSNLTMVRVRCPGWKLGGDRLLQRTIHCSRGQSASKKLSWGTTCFRARCPG